MLSRKRVFFRALLIKDGVLLLGKEALVVQESERLTA
jgi:hypothetical protein